jgi:hypothetical protein
MEKSKGMKSIFILILISMISFSSIGQIKDYRELILFYPLSKVDSATKQFQLLSKDLVGLTTRQIKITRVESNAKNSQLFKDYRLNPSLFSVVLIGKDGGVKFTNNKIISQVELYGIIDQMPMRRKEMGKQNQ